MSKLPMSIVEEEKKLHKTSKKHYMFHDREVKSMQQLMTHDNHRNITHPTQDKDKRFGRNMGKKREVQVPNDNGGKGFRTGREQKPAVAHHRGSGVAFGHFHRVKKN